MLKFQCLAFFAEIETRVYMVRLTSLSVVGTVEPSLMATFLQQPLLFFCPDGQKIYRLTLV